MYNLKITRLSPQRNTQALVKILLKVPGLTSEYIAQGLRVPPFDVLSVEKEDQAEKIRELLEKFGAVCEIIDTKPKRSELENFGKDYEKHIAITGGRRHELEYASLDMSKLKEDRHKFRWGFWLVIFGFFALFAIAVVVSENSKNQPKTNKSQTAHVVPKPSKPAKAEKPAKEKEKSSEKKLTPAPPAQNHTLKKDLMKNPYNAGAWKTLSENLEKKGDTAAARQAKDNYEKAMKAQLVMASLAKAFGNDVRVEAAEDAIYYRTNKNLTEDEFYKEAGRLRDSLAAKFPGKSMVIENYTPSGLQSIRLEAY